MRRMWILLAVGAVLLGLLAPAAYGAKGGIPGPPDLPDPPDTSPATGDIHYVTCAQIGDWVDAEGNPLPPAEGPFFDLTLDGDVRTDTPNNACVDVMADEGAWTIDIDVTRGTLREILLVPRDSVGAGDSCGEYRLRASNLGASHQLVLPGPDNESDIDGDGMIEAAYVNSCGTDFPEYLPDGVDPSSCVDFDGVYCHSVEPGIPSPLVLQVFTRGSKDMEVELHVVVPEYTGAPLP